MNWKKLHYFSGLVITVFILFHLINHFVSLAGLDQHILLMEALRRVYRFFIIEFLLLAAIGIQIYSGIKLFVKNRKSAKGFFRKIQLYSGLYLAIFFIIHLSAVFAGRWILKLDTNVYFGIAGLNTFPFLLFFIPYYGLAICSFFGHIASIHFIKMRKSVLGLTPRAQSYTILIFGVLFTLITFYGLTDGFRGVEIPTEYYILIGK